MHIKEDTPVTTTNNAGMGLDDPKSPIIPKNIFRRSKELSDKKKNLKSQNS